MDKSYRLEKLNIGIRLCALSFLYPFAIAYLIVLTSCNSGVKEPVITLAVSANMQFAIEELVTEFTNSSGISCSVTVSSSGKLAAQIREGAPYDVFVSADMNYPEELYQEGFTNGRPMIYAYGKLVLWTLIDSLSPDLSGLTNATIKHIALANPETAPYGAAAQEVLLKNGIRNNIEGKLVFGESIAQVNQFVYSGAAQIGFTAKSAVLSPQIKDRGRWVEIPATEYSPIAQGVVRLQSTALKQKASQAFFDYLKSDDAAGILQKYGFEIPEKLPEMQVLN
jgi:molybdate transport system substrate-binding protein